MRMWSLAPALLDRQALVACWRETLLAQAVLAGKTRGYNNHPQLVRFKRVSDPMGAVGAYLEYLHNEATSRGFTFNRSLIQVLPELSLAGGEVHGVGEPGSGEPCSGDGNMRVVAHHMEVTSGQLKYEAEHLRRKMTVRSPQQVPFLDDTLAHLDWEDVSGLTRIAHPLFVVVPGGIEPWEKI